MLWRMVIVSSPIKTSFTTSRTILCRSVILRVSAAPRRAVEERNEGFRQA